MSISAPKAGDSIRWVTEATVPTEHTAKVLRVEHGHAIVPTGLPHPGLEEGCVPFEWIVEVLP